MLIARRHDSTATSLLAKLITKLENSLPILSLNLTTAWRHHGSTTSLLVKFDVETAKYRNFKVESVCDILYPSVADTTHPK